MAEENQAVAGMIEGVVDEALRPLIEIPVKDSAGEFHLIPAIIDTGNQFGLVLPHEINLRLGLESSDSERVAVGVGGTRQAAPTYSAEIIWDGYRMVTEIVEMSNPPIVGTELLIGYSVMIEMRRAGRVVLERLDAW